MKTVKKSPTKPPTSPKPSPTAIIVGERIDHGQYLPAAPIVVYRIDPHGGVVKVTVGEHSIYLTRAQARSLSTAVWASSLWR